jgi:hypothetical protein
VILYGRNEGLEGDFEGLRKFLGEKLVEVEGNNVEYDGVNDNEVVKIKGC